jgi:hypothetical protein
METLRQELEEERKKSAGLEAKLAQQARGAEDGAEREACKSRQVWSQSSESSFDANSSFDADSLQFQESCDKSAISYDPDRLMQCKASDACDESRDNESYLSRDNARSWSCFEEAEEATEDTPRPGAFTPTPLSPRPRNRLTMASRLV